MDDTVVTLQTHHTCLYLESVPQMAPPLSGDSSHLIAGYWLAPFKDYHCHTIEVVGTQWRI